MIGIVIGTGPSLTDAIPDIKRLQEQGALLFGPNNTYQDFDLNVWLACDPAWHKHYGKIDLAHTDQWHWSPEICKTYGYTYVEGVWMIDGVAYSRNEYELAPGPVGGLWMEDKTKISLGHCSGHQLLNLAANQYGCDQILLVGHDFKYEPNKPRHYFSGLSDKDGEYPKQLRKFSKFIKPQGNDLLEVYKGIADQEGLPPITNCTQGSALPWFEFKELSDFF